MNKIIISLSFLGAILSAQPKWYNNSTDLNYPPAFYYIGLGSGASYEEAFVLAQTEIASQLKVSIISTLESSMREVSSDNLSLFYQDVSSRTTSEVNQNVSGIEIVKKESFEKHYYVYAVLDKEKYLSGLRTELKIISDKITGLFNAANDFLNEGKIFAALDNYTDANNEIVEFESKLIFYNSLSTSPFTDSNSLTPSDIISKIRNLLESIRINVISGDNQSGKIGAMLPEPVVFNVIYENLKSKEAIPISDIPVVVQYEDKTVIEKTRSDDAGKFEIYATVITESKKSGKIIAKLNLHRFPSMYKKYLEKVNAKVMFTPIEHIPVAFDIHIVDEDNNKVERVETQIAKNVEKFGYFISPKAELSLDGKIEISDIKTTEGKNGIRYLVNSELSLFMVVKSTGEKVASYETSGKGLGKNEKDALKKSYQKLKLKKKKLADMLSEAEDALEMVFQNKSNENYEEAMFLYNQGKLKQSVKYFSIVTYGANVGLALEKIRSAQKQLREIEEARLKRIQEEKDKLHD